MKNSASERISSHFVLRFDKDHDMRLSLHLSPQLINNAYIVHYILSRQPPNSLVQSTCSVTFNRKLAAIERKAKIQILSAGKNL